MSNSPLICHTNLSPNCSSRNGAKITKITPHHMSGNLSIESCGNTFKPVARQASSNYGIGTDGRIALYVDESMRAWTSSSYENDRRAVTIEVANCATGEPWPISDAAWNSLVALCVDICQRNGIKGLTWDGTPNGSLTAHYMFANTDCPGTTLKGRMQELADTVNSKLNNGWKPSAPSTPPASSGNSYTQKGFGGTYTCTVPNLNVRSAPSLSGAVVASYTKGQTVNLDDTYWIADGYVWGTYIGYSGNRRYIAVGRHTGKPENDDYLIKK